MNNGILPNSSNSAVRFNPLTQSLFIGDADQGRSLHGQLNVSIGQGNSLSGVSDKNVVIGSGNTITSGFGADNPGGADHNNNGNGRNIVLGTGNSLLGNRGSGSDGGCVVIGNQVALGTATTSAKYNAVLIGSNINAPTAIAAVAIGYGTNTNLNTVCVGNAAAVSGSSATSLGYASSSGASATAVGAGATASGASGVAVGSSATASGSNAIAIGVSSSSTAVASIGIGSGARAPVNGQFAIGAGALAMNKSQVSIHQLASNSNATTEFELTAGTTGTVRIPLRTFSMMSFRCQITARNLSNVAASKAWFIDGAITMNTGASTTALIGTPIITSFGGSGTDSWTATVTADTTNGALKVNCYSGGSMGVYWHARVDTVENNNS